MNTVTLLLKIVLDCLSRILLFSTWLYVINDGEFSSTKTVIAYLSTFFVLFIYNTILNKSKNYNTAITWIGEFGYKGELG